MVTKADESKSVELLYMKSFIKCYDELVMHDSWIPALFKKTNYSAKPHAMLNRYKKKAVGLLQRPESLQAWARIAEIGRINWKKSKTTFLIHRTVHKICWS